VNSVFLEIAPVAFFWALSPVIISVVILLLSTKRSIANTVSFVLPSFLGTMVVGVGLVVALQGYDYNKNSTGSDLTYVAAIICALVFFAITFVIWWKMPKGSRDMKMPKWVQYIDEMKPRTALVYGSILFLNNVFLTITAVGDVLRGQLSLASGIIMIISFILIGTLGMWVPLGYKLIKPEESVDKFERMREWLIVNNRLILILEFSILGAIQLIKGIVGLVG
jgi:Sap, sulfolipid-1-addressing protein